MKKLALTMAIIMGIGLSAYAQTEAFKNGGLFQLGSQPREFANGEDIVPLMPAHGQLTSQGAYGEQPAPLGTGAALLIGLGAAYLVGKKRKEE